MYKRQQCDCSGPRAFASKQAAADAWNKRHDEPRYTLTDLGNAYRSAMKRKAKLRGAVKAGEGDA